MQEQRSPIESQANTQNRSVPCCPESRNGQDDRQVKEHFTKDSCLLNDCPQEGIRKGLLSNMQQLFNSAEWLASNSPGGMTSVPPLLQAAPLGGKEQNPFRSVSESLTLFYLLLLCVLSHPLWPSASPWDWFQALWHCPHTPITSHSDLDKTNLIIVQSPMEAVSNLEKAQSHHPSL